MEQADLLRRVIEILEEIGVPYMVVGSFASGAYGEPRLTQDIDVVVDLTPEVAGRLCSAFPSPEFYVSEEAAMTAVRQRGQFNVIHPESGDKIDFMVTPATPWGRSQLSRRQKAHILPDQEGFLGSPEDIIISKMDYYREGGSEKHLRDIAGILEVSGEEVDRKYIGRWAEELRLTEIWEGILRRIEQGE